MLVTPVLSHFSGKKKKLLDLSAEKVTGNKNYSFCTTAMVAPAFTWFKASLYNSTLLMWVKLNQNGQLWSALKASENGVFFPGEVTSF